MYQDDDEEKDEILKSLSGEVDEYAGSQLKDPSGGVTIEISVKPQGGKPKEEPDMEAENEEHDPIAHILGMCEGGCAKE